MSEEDQTPGKDPVYQPRTPFGVQMLAGFGAWIIAIAIIVATARIPNIAGWEIIVEGVVFLAGLGFLSNWLERRFCWRGFVPGLALGLVMSCLVPIGIIAVTCGWRP